MELTKILFNPWIVGIILAAILAAVMSTLSCQLLVCSSALTEDLYKGFIRKNASQKELVWVGRIMVLAIAVLAIVLAGNPDSKVLTLLLMLGLVLVLHLDHSSSCHCSGNV